MVESSSLTVPCKMDIAPPSTSSSPVEIDLVIVVWRMLTTPRAASMRNAAPPVVEKPRVSESPANVASVPFPNTEKMDDLASPSIITFCVAVIVRSSVMAGKGERSLSVPPLANVIVSAPTCALANRIASRRLPLPPS